MTLLAVILICQLEAANCTAENALEIIHVPEEFDNVIACLTRSQSYLANTVANRGSFSGTAKIICQEVHHG